MAEQMEKPNYKKTLNLPKTGFPMKANLVQREPEMQKRWEKMNLYRQMREADHPRGRFTLHDGPPYANGSEEVVRPGTNRDPNIQSTGYRWSRRRIRWSQRP